MSTRETSDTLQYQLTAWPNNLRMRKAILSTSWQSWSTQLFFLIRTHLDPKVGRVYPLLPAKGNSKLGVTWPLVRMSAISSNPMLLLTRIRYYSVIGCVAPSIFKKLSRWEIRKKYILLVFNNYSTSARWIWVSYDYLISNKREWNNCFIKIDNSSQL